MSKLCLDVLHVCSEIQDHESKVNGQKFKVMHTIWTLIGQIKSLQLCTTDSAVSCTCT